MHDEHELEQPELLSLEDTEPVYLEEVEMPDGYLRAAKRHVGARLFRFKPKPERGEGAQ